LQDENERLSAGLEIRRESEFTGEDVTEASQTGVQKFAPALRHLTLGLIEDESESPSPQLQNQEVYREDTSIGSKNIKTSVNRPHSSTILLSRFTRQQSQYLVSFNFTHLSWIHCALHGPSFLFEHQRFYDRLEAGIYEDDHLWNALLLAVLSSSLFYLDRNISILVLGWPDSITSHLPLNDRLADSNRGG
jgi:hypothetical protein